MKHAAALFSLLILTPGIANAHEGHPHAGNALVHHGLESVALASIAVVACIVATRVLRRQDDAR